MEQQEPAVLVLNAGSSSVKCGLFTFEPRPRPVVQTIIDGAVTVSGPRLFAWIDDRLRDGPIAAIGHRIVHGGRRYRAPQRVTPSVIDHLTELIPFAPNHLPEEISLLRAVAERLPEAPQIACFDTAFHRDLPEVARTLPIPRNYDAQGVRRYGFHGLSCAYLMDELARIGGTEANGKVILAHLGNGSSLTAVAGGRSIDTTMAFTPIGGVVMSTRSGDLDPGVVTYIGRSGKLTSEEIDDLVSHRAGLLGVSGSTGDMRELMDRAPQDRACQLAIDMYVYSVRKAIGALAAVLGGLNTLVFSGGVGEHAAPIRAGICEHFGFLGIELDADQNAVHASVISPPSSRVRVRVIPTDEEMMIARAAYELLAGSANS